MIQYLQHTVTYKISLYLSSKCLCLTRGITGENVLVNMKMYVYVIVMMLSKPQLDFILYVT